jgi:hypothetical protein
MSAGSRDGWTPAFEGQRPPFEQGNELSLSHGAYSELRIGKRAAELVDDIRKDVVSYRSSDEWMVRLLALSWARVEAITAALETATEPSVQAELDRQQHRWVNRAAALLGQLGMTPKSRWAMGVDIAITARSAGLNVADLAAAAAAELAGDDSAGPAS